MKVPLQATSEQVVVIGNDNETPAFAQKHDPSQVSPHLCELFRHIRGLLPTSQFSARTDAMILKIPTSPSRGWRQASRVLPIG
jgi:hypothetical protein